MINTLADARVVRVVFRLSPVLDATIRDLHRATAATEGNYR
ncbi:hypothetical protein BN128_341 [Cronobacter sakazakii 696]|nr:hypothetical protein BN128_341 [Cronobacter sakazakii 696]